MVGESRADSADRLGGCDQDRNDDAAERRRGLQRLDQVVDGTRELLGEKDHRQEIGDQQGRMAERRARARDRLGAARGDDGARAFLVLVGEAESRDAGRSAWPET